jgi:hypothetical protein
MDLSLRSSLNLPFYEVTSYLWGSYHDAGGVCDGSVGDAVVSLAGEGVDLV